MRMECDPAAPRRLPATAWLLAAAPASSPWYLKLLGAAIMATFGFFLLRMLYRLAASLMPRKRRHAAALVLRWSGTAGNLQAEPLHWALASILVFSVRNRDVWDQLQLDDPVEESRELLRASWGIRDQAGLKAQLFDLLGEGHRAHLQPMVQRFAAMPQDRYEEARAQILSQPESPEQREHLWQMAAARDNRDGIRHVDFLAWDLVRYIWLCRQGLHLGYLEEPEARAMMLRQARLLQQRYRGWEDCATQFMQARAFWAGGDPSMEASQQAVRDTIHLLRKDRHSPWKLIDWAMPLGNASA